MKKLTILVVALLTMVITAQAQEIQKLFDKYSNDERFTYVSIGSGVMGLASVFNKGKTEGATKDLISKITGLKILSLEHEQGTTETNKKLFKSISDDFNSIITKAAKETLVEIRDKGEGMNIYLIDDGIIMFSKDGNELTLIWISGDIKKSDMETLMSSINIKH
ncbi:MAG: DUF4252 domain-containing protein [Prevotellaceae bacterium]|jgi:hypothetical protein|nr:DUF4252 domain-containing protein [Prevotellaceae bacterium]